MLNSFDYFNQYSNMVNESIYLLNSIWSYLEENIVGMQTKNQLDYHLKPKS